MELKEKLEILIKRKGYKKTEFADTLGITYRALANYISGDRYPRRRILEDMASLLDADIGFLTDDDQTLILTSTEKLYFKGLSDKSLLSEADDILERIEILLSDNAFENADKTAFFNCVSEKYFASKKKF